MKLKKKEITDENKKLKMILFFVFYLVFFILLSIYLKNYQDKEKINDIEKQEIKNEITTIKDLFNKDFTYQFEINDNGVIINFNGSKKNIDYESYENKYFLDYVNLNQIIKKAKVISNSQIMASYEIDNQTLNELLNTDNLDGVNEIKEYYGRINNQVNQNEYQVILNLDNYMGRIYTITLKYKVGENNE